MNEVTKDMARNAGLPGNVITHRFHWRKAIEMAIENAPRATEDSDEAGYWRHELAAFDRAFDRMWEIIKERDAAGEQYARDVYTRKDGQVTLERAPIKDVPEWVQKFEQGLGLREAEVHNADMAWPSEDGERFASSVADLIGHMYAEDDVENGEIVTVNIGKSLGSADVRVKVDDNEDVSYEVIP